MASITPLGGPRRRDYYSELRDAVAADLTCSTEATRAKVIAARLAYLESKRQLEKRCDFELLVSRRMGLLTAPPVPVEPKRREWDLVWLWPVFCFVLATAAGYLAWVLLP